MFGNAERDLLGGNTDVPGLGGGYVRAHLFRDIRRFAAT
jgi:hypothetical protein